MNDKLDKIEIKLDKVVEKISAIDVTLASQHISLKEHIRRTELLEDDVAPLKKHDAMFMGALKLIGIVALCAGAIESIVILLEFLRK